MHDLEEQFLTRGINRGGVLMLAAVDALAFIDAARQEHKSVLGIDSFVITKNTTEPQMDHILDLSTAQSGVDTWSEARRFIEQRQSTGFLFEVVLSHRSG